MCRNRFWLEVITHLPSCVSTNGQYLVDGGFLMMCIWEMIYIGRQEAMFIELRRFNRWKGGLTISCLYNWRFPVCSMHVFVDHMIEVNSGVYVCCSSLTKFLSVHFLSFLVLSCHVWSSLVVSCLVLHCLVLPCLSYLVLLFSPVLSCLV